MEETSAAKEIAAWLERVSLLGLPIGFSRRSDPSFTVGFVEGVRADTLEFFEKNPPYVGPMEVPIIDIDPDSLSYLSNRTYTSWREPLPK